MKLLKIGHGSGSLARFNTEYSNGKSSIIFCRPGSRIHIIKSIHKLAHYDKFIEIL